MFRWSIAIFSARESITTLAASIEAAVVASGTTATIIDIVVNGNEQLASETKAFIQTLRGSGTAAKSVRVWFLAVADKAYTWNSYVHGIWERSDIGYFIDGCAQVFPDSLSLIDKLLHAEPSALAASGVPTIGRSANASREEMLREGGINGNLYAIRGDVLEQLRQRGFYLPVGLYRGDSLVGAVICFGLDPAINMWDYKRLLVHSEATWSFPTLVWWRASDLRQAFERMGRQAQGILENLSIQEHLAIQRKAPEKLPRSVRHLIWSWVESHPTRARKVFIRHPLCYLAAKKLRSRKNILLPNASPVLIGVKEF